MLGVYICSLYTVFDSVFQNTITKLLSHSHLIPLMQGPVYFAIFNFKLTVSAFVRDIKYRNFSRIAQKDDKEFLRLL